MCKVIYVLRALWIDTNEYRETVHEKNLEQYWESISFYDERLWKQENFHMFPTLPVINVV